MAVNTLELIDTLTKMTEQHLIRAKEYKILPSDQLIWQETPTRWNVLHNIEHLNRYGDFYLPEIEKSISSSKHHATEIFRSAWLGNYFAESMVYREKLNKMKTFKSKNPVNQQLSTEIIDTFIQQQHTTLALLEKAKRVDLAKAKTATTIARWLKISLGDVFRVVIYHNERHIIQANKSLEAQGK